MNQGDPGYDTIGGWINFVGQGIGGTVDYVAAGDGTQVARWRAKRTSGKHNVAVVWEAMANRATDSPFKIILEGEEEQVLLEVEVNQELPPASFQDTEGTWWHSLGDVTISEDATLRVELNNAADDYVIADAVRFEKLDDPTPPPPDDGRVALPISFHNGRETVHRDEQGNVCLTIHETVARD